MFGSLIRTVSFYSKKVQSFNFERYLPRSPTHTSMGLSLDYNINSISKGLSIPVWDMIDRGGKLWRGSLCLITAAVFDYPIDPLIPLSFAIELLHQGSLICDDIEDQSENRRGKPCTYKIFGVDTALNAGNFIYFLALRIIQDSSLPEASKALIHQDFTDEIIKLHYGQCSDIEWSKSEYLPTQAEYLRMVLNKTSVLARLATKFALRAAEVQEDSANAVLAYVENVGIGFQIWDDIINLESEDYAKTRSYLGEDITEGKKSLIVIKAVEENPRRGEKLKEILKMRTADQKLVNEALGIIKDTRAIDRCKQFAAEIIEKSWKDLEGKLKDSKAKNDLYELSFKLINRKT